MVSGISLELFDSKKKSNRESGGGQQFTTLNYFNNNSTAVLPRLKCHWHCQSKMQSSPCIIHQVNQEIQKDIYFYVDICISVIFSELTERQWNGLVLHAAATKLFILY